MTIHRTLLVLFGATAQIAWGQLYLLGGAAGADGGLGTAAALFQVGSDGTVKRTVTLVEGPVLDERGRMPPLNGKSGLFWIGIAYEWRKLVVISGFPEYAATVVDFDKALPVKRCNLPHNSGTALFRAWFAEPPGRGPTLEWSGFTDNEHGSFVFQGMAVDPGVPCEESMRALKGDDMRLAFTHGWGGGLSAYASPHLDFGLDQTNGTLFHLDDGPATRTVLGYQVPAELQQGFRGSAVGVDDSHALELCLFDDNGAYRDLIFRKSDKTWHVLPATLGPRPPYSRSFGRYVAFTEVQPKTAQNPRSAGQEEWRRSSSEMNAGSWAIEETGRVYPGNLYIYDVDTERVFPIRTKQGDSEVLLIENGTVYWRAARRLYSAPLTDSGIGEPRLLVNDETILDTHYAFLKR